jgi:hypothetical protein
VTSPLQGIELSREKGASKTVEGIVPDDHWPRMFRVRLAGGGLSDMVNLTRAREATLNEPRNPAGSVTEFIDDKEHRTRGVGRMSEDWLRSSPSFLRSAITEEAANDAARPENGRGMGAGYLEEPSADFQVNQEIRATILAAARVDADEADVKRLTQALGKLDSSK